MSPYTCGFRSPSTLRPVRNKVFLDALEKSTNEDFKVLTNKYRDCLTFSVNIQGISAQIAGEINIGGI